MPRDAKLLADASEFYRTEFNTAPEFTNFAKVWAILGDDGLILGLTGVTSVVDCPLFHIKVPSMDKKGLRQAEAARDMAVWRMHSHLEDSGLSGTNALIYVSPETERYWHRFLDRIHATPAHRWEMRI